MTPDDAADLLIVAGVEVTGSRGSEVYGLCPGHRERTGRQDRHPSWSFNSDKQTHHCFSCGYSGNLLQLISDVRGLGNLDEARAWLRDVGGYDISDLRERMEMLRESYITPTKVVPMSEARLAVFTDPPEDALQARRLTLESCLHYGVRWDPEHRSWITPIRDPGDYHLMGWQQKSQDGRLFRNRPAGVAKSITLFGLDVWNGEEMLVVESPLDAVRAHSAGVHGAVATFGASVSEAQYFLMRQSSRLTLAFDNDDAGRSALDKAYQAARRLRFDFWVFDYHDAEVKDIGDMDDVAICLGVDRARHSVRKVLA